MKLKKIKKEDMSLDEVEKKLNDIRLDISNFNGFNIIIGKDINNIICIRVDLNYEEEPIIYENIIKYGWFDHMFFVETIDALDYLHSNNIDYIHVEYIRSFE